MGPLIMPPHMSGNEFHSILVKTHRTGSIIGIIIGGLICILGVTVIILGISGNIYWIVTISGISSKILNASPGIIISIVGLIIMIRFKPKVTYEYEIKKTPTTYYERGGGSASSPLSR